MKIAIFFITILHATFIFCQTPKRASTFFDFQLFYGIDNSKANPSFTGKGLLWEVNGSSDKYVGNKMRFGRNWYVGKTEKKNVILQVSWIECGLYSAGGIFNPLQIGLGRRFLFSEKKSIEFLTNGGAFFYTDDFLFPSIDAGMCWNFEMKYCHYQWKYGIHWQHYSSLSFQYFGLNVGFNIHKK
jgi:hypothetical protein